MLLNGKEINHLIIGGEVFDKNYSLGKKIKVIRQTTLGRVMFDGTVRDLGMKESGYVLPIGYTAIAIARYNDAIYITSPKQGLVLNTGWISIKDVAFID
ncbi:MAG: hypothetical protein J6565_08000 [Lactobacillus sp.]|nr:hypothetical protein [Lactobacillus sp.]